MTRARAPLAHAFRVAVLRSREAAGLGALVTAHCPTGETARLPAGPFGFEYAAALELARLAHGNESIDPGDRPLSRSTLVRALRGLVVRDLTIVVPRLDWLDASSAILFSDLLEFAELAAAQTARAGLCLVGGLQAGSDGPALARLLARAHCTDLEGNAPRAVMLTSDDRATLAALRASPMPLSARDLSRVCGLKAKALDTVIRKFASAHVFEAGPRIGLGTASALIDEGDLTPWRRALLDEGVLTLPDARLAVTAKLGLAAREAIELARQALAEDDPRLALSRIRCLPHAVVLKPQEELLRARIMAEAGYSEAALETCRAYSRSAATLEQIEVARLAHALWKHSALPAREAAALVRRGARSCADNADAAVELATYSAEISAREGRHGSALKLLSRVGAQKVAAARPVNRVRHLVQLARCQFAQGNPKRAAAALTSARTTAREQDSLIVERAALEIGDQSAGKSLLELAARHLHIESARLALSHVKERGALIRGLGGERKDQAFVAIPTQEDGLFDFCRSYGASLLAYWRDGEMGVCPAEARSRPGLCAWLEAHLASLAAHPGTSLIALGRTPLAGKFGGDLVMSVSAIGRFGPAILIFKRAKLRDAEQLLQLLGDPANLLRWMLNQRLLSADDVLELLGEHTHFEEQHGRLGIGARTAETRA